MAGYEGREGYDASLEEKQGGGIPIGYCGLNLNFSRNTLSMYSGLASRTLMSSNHSWKPSAVTNSIPGGSAPWIYIFPLEPYFAVWYVGNRVGRVHTLDNSLERRFVAKLIVALCSPVGLWISGCWLEATILLWRKTQSLFIL